MKETFFDFLGFLKKPTIEKDSNNALPYRFQVFVKMLLFCIFFASITTPIFTIFEDLGWISLENHKVQEVFKDLPWFVVILVGGIIVPFIEELLFRAPITLFKKPEVFVYAFYVFAIAFGLVHITNFEMTTMVLILAPILVVPQLFAGFALGFLRVRFGLRWAVLLHCVYNIFFLSVSLIFGA